MPRNGACRRATALAGAVFGLLEALFAGLLDVINT